MFNIVLVCPEIPPNTGNVIRLAANSGCRLHLIEPLGFSLDDAHLRRAGLDYREYATIRVHRDWQAFLAAEHPDLERLFAMSSHAQASLYQAHFLPGDWLVFGRESCGLGAEFLAAIAPQRRIRIPMMPGNRSLNLSNSVAVTVFEAWRQNGFAGSI